MNKLFILIVLQTSSVHVIINSLRRPVPREAVPQKGSRSPHLLTKNDAGCDAVLDSCGEKGECCDEHDQCYAINKCTASSWISGPGSGECWNCNLNVMKCVVTQNPGMSSCCSAGTCGRNEDDLEAGR